MTIAARLPRWVALLMPHSMPSARAHANDSLLPRGGPPPSVQPANATPYPNTNEKADAPGAKQPCGRLDLLLVPIHKTMTGSVSKSFPAWRQQISRLGLPSIDIPAWKLLDILEAKLA